VIIISVSEGKQKPYSCPAGFFMRMGDGKQKLNRNQILEFLQREGRVRYDEIVRESLPVEGHFDQKAYSRFLKLSNISEVLDRNVILKNLGCAADTSSGLMFTNAGALFFRNNDEDIEFHHAGVVCALYKGLVKVNILDAQTYASNIVDSIDNALAFLKRNLRTRYEIEGFGPRKNILELPEAGLKEAITNACAHRQYFEKGARVMAEIFDDRVDITSPGGVPSGITPENFGKRSITRNPIIANLLHRIDYIEKMGTGINRMRLAAEEAGVAEPEFSYDTFFTVTFKRTPLPEPVASVKEGFTEKFTEKFTEGEQELLKVVAKNPGLTTTEMAAILNISRQTVSKRIRVLREKGALTRVGSDTKGHWKVAEAEQNAC
jgi:ATP-dependent DNA helicase RecG